MKKLLFMLCATAISNLAMAQYSPDVLGSNFECATIELEDSFDGKVVTTLVRYKPDPLVPISRAVLYVHGYNDYFFQTEMAEKFVEQEWQFYALDLRRYGRSMREWQQPFALSSIEEYFEDIDAAIEMMLSDGITEIILMGHSTGGLTTSLYCHHHREHPKVEALILNSPFFDMNLSGMLEGVAIPFVSWMAGAKAFKEWRVMSGDDSPGGYGRSLHKSHDGEWDFDTQFKRLESLPITAGWIRAINRGHKQLQKGLQIPIPVLLLYSDKSVGKPYDKEKFQSGDSVLDVADIAKYGSKLGDNVTQLVIADGMHDLVLSTPEVRYPLYVKIFEWSFFNK